MLVLKVECVTVNVSIHRIEVYMRGKKKQTNPNKKNNKKKFAFLSKTGNIAEEAWQWRKKAVNCYFLQAFWLLI